MELFSNAFIVTLGIGFGVITICTAAALVDLITSGLVEAALARLARGPSHPPHTTLSQSTATRTN